MTDNPIVDLEGKMFLHGGNFHGEYMAVAADHLKMAMVKTTILSERRSNFFLNKNVNQEFPPFLNMNQPGLTLALQGMQFVATSTTAHSQSLAYPHSLHSISTNGDNQDVVSMGTDAALIASTVMKNAFIVLAIELIALAQAVDIKKVEDRLLPMIRICCISTCGPSCRYLSKTVPLLESLMRSWPHLRATRRSRSNNPTMEHPLIYTNQSEVPAGASRVDARASALEELYSVRHPAGKKGTPEYLAEQKKFIVESTIPSVYIHYPWANTVVETAPRGGILRAPHGAQ